MKDMTPKELTDYLRDHIHYEVLMLRHCYERMGTSRGLDFNAFLEAFAVHARVLAEFLSEGAKTRNDVRARQYVGGFRSERKDGLIRDTLDKLDEQIFHSSAKRTKDPEKQFNTNLATELWSWIERDVLKFNAALQSPYPKDWMPTGPLPAALPYIWEAFASSHMTTASSQSFFADLTKGT
jgi:hypothetical protein